MEGIFGWAKHTVIDFLSVKKSRSRPMVTTSTNVPLGDMILSDVMNLNQELTKQGWCWWYRKYALLDTQLEGLEKAAREGRKGLWADPQPVQERLG